MEMNCANCPKLTTISEVTLARSCGTSSIMMFMSILEIFIRKQCDLEDPCHRIRPRENLNTSYDYIVIGAGSAGSVIAARLSEDKDRSILLIEAGLDEPAWTHVPSFFLNPMHTDMDWNYSYEGDECSNGNEAKCYWPRGKVLGGSSVINAMIYMRGAHQDFDDWERMGNKGWSYNDVLPYFKKSENNQQIDKLDTVYHNQGGPLSVSYLNYLPPITNDILKAGQEFGYNTIDFNGANHTGFSIVQTTTNNGSRVSSARAFLRPARDRENLHILINSTVSRILFDDNKKATAVEIHRNGEFIRVDVNKEVIVSGGIVNSPQILLNSGIGPREELEAIGIPVIHDLPGVGKNLHDHFNTLINFSINETVYNDVNWASALDYLLYRKGPLSGIGSITVAGHTKSRLAQAQDDHPDIQLVIDGYLANCAENGVIYNDSPGRRQIAFVTIVVRPRSKGYVRLRNNDPLSKPLIYPRYLSHPDDIAIMMDGIKFALQFAKAKAFKKYDLQLEMTPVKNCEHLEFGSDSYWECAIKEIKNPGYHQAGSCKMGSDTDPLAVVDHLLRLRGIQNVRVADASVMPQVTSANPNAATIMIGERAADFIRKVIS